MGRGGGRLRGRRREPGRARRALPRQHRALQAAEGLRVRRRAAEEQLRQDPQDRAARQGSRGGDLIAVLRMFGRTTIMRALIASAGGTMWRSISSVGLLLLGLGSLTSVHAQPVDSARPAVGGVASLADAMIFYVARGAPGACGPGCSEWIAAEGAIQWDSHKRLLAVLGKVGEHRLPLVLDMRGDANLNVAVSMGRII